MLMYVANPRSIDVYRKSVYEIVVIKGVGNVNLTVSSPISLENRIREVKGFLPNPAVIIAVSNAIVI